MQLPVHRYRERGALAVPRAMTEYARWLNCTQSNWVWNSNPGTGFALGTRERMSDVLTPGFHRRSEKGEVIISDLTQIRQTYTSSAAMGTHIRLKTGQSCTGFKRYPEYEVRGPYLEKLVQSGWLMPSDNGVPITTLLNHEDIGAAMREASTKLLANRGSSKGNLYESLAEADKTAGMIGQLVEHKNSLLTDSKLNKAKTLASGYLLMRYGFGPLIKDVDTLLKAQGYEDRKRRLTTRSFALLTEQSTVTKNVSPGSTSYVLNQLNSDSVNIRAMSLDEVRVGQMYESGFSAKGLIKVPYELIPYSFVVDWVFTLGDYLASMIPTPSFVQLGSCIVTERVSVSSYSVVGATNSIYDILRVPDGSCQGVHYTKQRVPGHLGATLAVRGDFRLTETIRALDAVALLMSRLDHFRAKKFINRVRNALANRRS